MREDIKAGDLVTYNGGDTRIPLGESARVQDITGVQDVRFALVRLGGRSWRIPTEQLTLVHEVRLVADERDALRAEIEVLKARISKARGLVITFGNDNVGLYNALLSALDGVEDL